MLRRVVREIVRESDDRRPTFICRQCGCEQEATLGVEARDVRAENEQRERELDAQD